MRVGVRTHRLLRQGADRAPSSPAGDFRSADEYAPHRHHHNRCHRPPRPPCRGRRCERQGHKEAEVRQRRRREGARGTQHPPLHRRSQRRREKEEDALTHTRTRNAAPRGDVRGATAADGCAHDEGLHPLGTHTHTHITDARRGTPTPSHRRKDDAHSLRQAGEKGQQEKKMLMYTENLNEEGDVGRTHTHTHIGGRRQRNSRVREVAATAS